MNKKIKKKINKKIWLIIGVVIIIALLVWGWRQRQDDQAQYTTVPIEIGPLVQTVNLTGTIKPTKELALNLLSTGQISNITVEVGDHIETGQLLVELDQEALLLRRSEAEAGLQIAQANLSKLLAGASSQTIAINQSSLDQAIVSQQTAQLELEKIQKTVDENIRQAEKVVADLVDNTANTITNQEQAVTTAQTSLNNLQKTGQVSIDHSRSSALIVANDKILLAQIALDNIKTLLNDDDARYVLSVKDSAYLQKTKTSHSLAIDQRSQASQAVSQAQNSQGHNPLVKAINQTKELLQLAAQSLGYSYSMLEATITSNNFSQAKLDSYKSIISGQIAQINAAIVAIESVWQNYNTAKTNHETNLAAAQENLNQAQVALGNARLVAQDNLVNIRLASERQISQAQSQLQNAIKGVEVARAQLANTKAPARSADIALVQGQITQAEANLASVQKQISDSQLISPLAGVVAEVNYEVGEQFSPSTRPLITVLANNDFNIEVEVTEADINKVRVGNRVAVTLDAFGPDQAFSGQVYFIEPAQTVIQDVVYYKVKISLDNYGQELIKAGMTANVTITTAQRDEVFKVPSRAIIDSAEQGKIIRLLRNNQLVEVPVSLGLRGDAGLVEVIGEFNPDDQVITFIKYPAGKLNNSSN